jgi:hypothetical protein
MFSTLVTYKAILLTNNFNTWGWPIEAETYNVF